MENAINELLIPNGLSIGNSFTKMVNGNGDAIKYYISSRNCWDTVKIGPFDSYGEAKKCLQIGWGEELIKEIK